VAESTGQPRIVLSPAAQRDIRDVLQWSAKKFGEHAAARYQALLKQASVTLPPILNAWAPKQDSSLPREFVLITCATAGTARQALLALSASPATS